MSIKKLLLLFFLISTMHILNAQSIVGTWKTIDDNDNIEKSLVQIYEKGDKYYGKVIELLRGATVEVCDECEGENKGKHIVGMDIIEGLEACKDYWKGGTVLDPGTGKTYKCYVELEEPDVLKLRGYIGFPALGRTQYWTRVN